MKEYQQILTDLKRKIYKPVYFLQGEEPYFIDKLADFIEESVLDASEKEFNQMVLYGKETDLGSIVSAARRYPMMSEFQVLIIKEAQNIKEFAKKGSTDEEEEGNIEKESSNPANALGAFLNYLENPQSSTILVLCHKYKKVDKRTALAKLLSKKAVIFDSDKLRDYQMGDWISGFLKEKNFKISPRASALLVDYLGTEIAKVANELEKLMITLKPGTEINTEQIQEKIGISKDYNVFELQDAFGKKDILKANRIIQYFSDNPKDNPMPLILANLYTYFNRLLQYHFLQDKSKANVAKTFGMHIYFVDGIASAASVYPTSKLKSIFSWLRDTDLRSKGIGNNGTNDGELLKELTFKILH
jgi:DNA polymerase-3 subunit delta